MTSYVRAKYYLQYKDSWFLSLISNLFFLLFKTKHRRCVRFHNVYLQLSQRWVNNLSNLPFVVEGSVGGTVD